MSHLDLKFKKKKKKKLLKYYYHLNLKKNDKIMLDDTLLSLN